MTKLKIKIDGHEIEMDADSSPATILEAARLVGIQIPTLCHHPSLEPMDLAGCALCRSKKMAGKSLSLPATILWERDLS